ncbi:MAG: hypothetical protein KBD00_06000 [Candidatus Peribacteraceae bacterium]|nr:hypothetical protein [Candidatus Peribacteraceae bacterium]
MTQIVLLSAVTLVACLSPALTLVKLWQLKEWRWDRLLEHLGAEGMFQQVFGFLRPVLLGTWLLLLIGISLAGINIWLFPIGCAIALLAPLATLSLLQIALRKQKMPVWTLKAKVILMGTIMLTLVVAILLSATKEAVIALAFLPLLQPLFLVIAWMIFLPIDRPLKKRRTAQATALRDQFSNLLVIGVTGSVGKTTTKELLAHILAPLSPLVTPEHVNTEMGVATWLLQTLPMLKRIDSRIAIVEMGAYKMGEIDAICRMTKPTIGIVTRIGEEHLALFGSRQNIAQAKSELLAALPQTGHAFFPIADTFADYLRTRTQATVHTIGTAKPADVIFEQATSDASGIHFMMDGTSYTIPIQGMHNIPNAALAIACAQKIANLVQVQNIAAPIQPQNFAALLKTFALQQHTFNPRREHDVDILDATYNASPQSFEAAIEWAASQPHAQKYLLTSGIIELGTEEAPLHEAIAKKASSVFTQAFITSKRFLPYFIQGGFSNRAMLTKDVKTKLPKNSLLVCISRMPDATINKLLP